MLYDDDGGGVVVELFVAVVAVVVFVVIVVATTSVVWGVVVLAVTVVLLFCCPAGGDCFEVLLPNKFEKNFLIEVIGPVLGAGTGPAAARTGSVPWAVWADVSVL